MCGQPGERLPDDMATTRCELALRGPVSHTLLEVIRTRFDQVSTPDADSSVLIIEDFDQASVRALLTLLWDAGHEMVSLTPLNTLLNDHRDRRSS
jgi:hypothetical protein